MPKASEFPKFRTSTKRGPAGQMWTSYWYDNRGTGRPDVALGTDREKALAKWRELRTAAENGVKHPPARKRTARAQPFETAPRASAVGKRRNFYHPDWLSHAAWVKPLYLMVEARSRRDGRVSFLSPAEYLDVVRRAGGHCEVSGLPFDLGRPRAGRRAPFAPSLDRIDCDKGYIAGNVRLVCVIANCALGDFGEAALETFARAFLARLRESLPQGCESDFQDRL